MSIGATFSRLMGRTRARTAAKASPVSSPRLAVETLEDRCLLSATIVDLGTFGGLISHGYAVNSVGMVAGDAEGTGGPKKNYPFVYSGGSKTQIPTPGFDYGVSRAMNERGQVVGFMYSLGDVPVHHAFSYQNGVTKDLGTLGGKGSQAYGNNDKGQIVGLAHTADDVGHAFLWTRNRMIDLGSLGGESFAYDINNKTQVVGYYLDDVGAKRSFLWNKGYMYDLSDFGGIESDAWGINDHGQVAGYANNANDEDRAYLWQPHSPNGSSGDLIDLGLLANGHESFAYNLNNRGEVVGACQMTSGQFRAFVWRPDAPNSTTGAMIDLNDYLPQNSEWNFLNYAMAINDAGQITGYGFKKDMSLHAFLLTFDRSEPVLSASDKAALARVVRAISAAPVIDVTVNTPAASRPEAPAPPSADTTVRTLVRASTSPQTPNAYVAAQGDVLFVSPLTVTHLVSWQV
jgi:probable HAF family extracellular repeat protein